MAKAGPDVGPAPEATVGVARRMSASAARWGAGAAVLSAVGAAVVQGVRLGGQEAFAAAAAVLVGAVLAVAVLATGPRVLATVGVTAEPRLLLVVALSVHLFWVTLLAAVAAWLLRWGALPRECVGVGVLTAGLAATAGLVRSFIHVRMLTFGDSTCDAGHTGPSDVRG